MNRFGRVALVCAAIVAISCSSAQDVAPTTTGPPTTTAPPSTTATAPSTTTATGPTTSTTSPTAFRSGRLTAGTYVATPFAPPFGEGECVVPPQPGCSELDADSIRFTFNVPDGWIGWHGNLLESPAGFTAPDAAAIIFNRGGWLHTDPCHPTFPPNIPVGPTVDDFANALADNPALEVTTPVDVTFAGFSGKYIELQVPSDIAGCTDHYWAWEPNYYAQGPSQRWHLWILDVDGVRVVVETWDYPGTSAEDRAELQAILDSMQIAP